MDLKVDSPNPNQTIWLENDGSVGIIDQRYLPHQLKLEKITTKKEMCRAISEMRVRGAPLLGVAGAFAMYLAARESLGISLDKWLDNSLNEIISTRPTAVNLSWGARRVAKAMRRSNSDWVEIAARESLQILNEDIETCRLIGEFGSRLISEIADRKGGPVQILTHCNAGWLACVKHGTATAPIYNAHGQGIDLHVWVDETRPRNQGASLTAWELLNSDVSNTIIVDNCGGHLMQQGMVDFVIVGADRVARNGDVANKIGTYLKALAAFDNNIPFYVACPSSTIDWNTEVGSDIEIEERSEREVKYISGLDDTGKNCEILITPNESKAINYGFDVTPARLITGIITEGGVVMPSASDICRAFPNLASTRVVCD